MKHRLEESAHSSIDLIELGPGEAIRLSELAIGKAPSFGRGRKRRREIVSASMRERLLDGCTQCRSIHWAEAGQDREIRQITDARVWLRARQAAALQFLLANAFTTPRFLIRPELLRRMEPAGALNRVRNAQYAVMNSLLQNARIERLIEQSALDGAAAYAPVQFLTDLRRGIWSDLATPARPTDQFRRNVQIVYLDTFDNRLNGGPAPDPAVRALLRGELRALRAQIGAAVAAATDRASRLHLEDSRDRIDEILDPRAMRPRAAPGGSGGAAAAIAGDDGSVVADRFDFRNDMFARVPETCWPDYVVQ